MSAILAFASCGGGDSDDEVVIPAAPGAATITGSYARLSLSWNSVEGAAAYEVWFHTADDPLSALQSGGDIAETAYVLNGLVNGTTYYV